MANRAKLTAALDKVGLKARLVRTGSGGIYWALHFPKTDNILEATVNNDGVIFHGNGSTAREFPEDLFDTHAEWSMAVLTYFWDMIQTMTELRIIPTLEAVQGNTAVNHGQ